MIEFLVQKMSIINLLIMEKYNFYLMFFSICIVKLINYLINKHIMKFHLKKIILFNKFSSFFFNFGRYQYFINICIDIFIFLTFNICIDTDNFIFE